MNPACCRIRLAPRPYEEQVMHYDAAVTVAGILGRPLACVTVAHRHSAVRTLRAVMDFLLAVPEELG